MFAVITMGGRSNGKRTNKLCSEESKCKLGILRTSVGSIAYFSVAR